jgi:outer membrane protein TolC
VMVTGTGMVLALCASASALTLDEARALAAERAVEVQRQAASAEVASGAALEALADNLPTIAAFGSVNTGAGFTSFGIARPPSTQIGGGLSGSWLVLSPSGWAAAAAARRSARGEVALLDWARATARRDATVAYAEALAAEETLAARQRAAADAARAAEGVASLAAAGVRPDADRARAQATAAALAADEVAVAGEVAARCAALQSLLGLDIDGRCELEAVAWDEPAAGGGPHPAVIAAEEALGAARAARQSTMLARAPSLSAEGSAGEYVAVQPDVGTVSGTGWNAQLRLDVPLAASGGGVGRLRQARGAQSAAEAALEAQERALGLARIAAEARFESAAAAAGAREDAVRAADEALALVDARYRQGLEDLEAWLLARRDRDESLVAMAAARAEVGRALAEVEAVRGVR